MKVIINIIKYIAIILLTCAIIGLLIINIVSSTILSKQYVLSKLEETNYYEEIKKEIESSFENYIGQSGLDENVIKDIVSMKKIKEDTNIIITNIYKGTQKTVNTTEIETNLKNNIEASLENKKLTITQQKAIDEYINRIASQYKQTMSHTSYENDINQMVKKVNRYIEKSKKVVIIGIAVLILLILVLNYKKLMRGIAQTGIALLSSGIFYVTLKMYINFKIKISNIVILNDAISNVVKTVMTDILSKIAQNGIILVCFGIVMIVVGNVIINNSKTKERKEQE